MKLVKDFYVSPEIAKKVESEMCRRFQRNKYEKITDAQEFASQFTEDLRVITKDMHPDVLFSRQPIHVTKENEELTAEEIARFENFFKACQLLL